MMRKFSEQYAKSSGTYFCMDKGVTATVIKGLAQHKEELGAPLCPCRHYDDKEAEVKNGFWNCPCVPMRYGSLMVMGLLGLSPALNVRGSARRERKECHCMLFLTDDNDFAGSDKNITSEELKSLG